MQCEPLLVSRILDYGVRLHGDQEVVTWTAEGPRRTTYADVGRQAAQLANALRGLGITGDQRVATFMWNNAEHLTAYLAIPSMGAVLHALNIRLFPEQILYVAQHAGDEVVIVDNTLAAPFAKLLAHLPGIRHVIVNGPVDEPTAAALREPQHVEGVHDYADLLAAQSDAFAWPRDLDEDSAAAMCYTSGTTGNPKGVVYSHRSDVLHTMAVTAIAGIRQGDRALVVVPLFHANAWGLPYVAFQAGASLILPDRYLQAEPLATMIETERVTTGGGVPTIWSDLLRHLDTHPTDTSSLRSLLVGGSACPPALLRAYEERHGIHITHAWGMTETSPVGSMAIAPSEAGVGTDDYWRYRSTQGRLLFGVDARLIGPDGTEQPWDGHSVGELEVCGNWIAGSYYANGSESEAEKAEMAAKFDDGWLRTGDVGALTSDGFLILTDRSKDVIKSGGEWISSVDLENAIMSHPDVIEATVVGILDERWGERPLATVVLREGATAGIDDLRDHLEGRLAHWQVPDQWAIVDEVPKTSVGKFDKKVVRRRYAAGELDVTTAGPPTA